MGQQQLLLLVLGIVIVGLAVVVGISSFDENNVKSNADAIATDLLRMASDAQAWALKPEIAGGKAATQGIEDANLIFDLGYHAVNGHVVNANAWYYIENNTDDCEPITMPEGAGSDGPLYIKGYNPSTRVIACVRVTGTDDASIGLSINYDGERIYVPGT